MLCVAEGQSETELWLTLDSMLGALPFILSTMWNSEGFPSEKRHGNECILDRQYGVKVEFSGQYGKEHLWNTNPPIGAFFILSHSSHTTNLHGRQLYLNFTGDKKEAQRLATKWWAKISVHQAKWLSNYCSSMKGLHGTQRMEVNEWATKNIAKEILADVDN